MTEYSLFRASEILDMAIQLEHHGLAFYKACVQAALSTPAAEVFEHMSTEEQKHIEIFTRMKEDLADYLPPETYPGEMRRYLESFTRDKVFQEPVKASQQACKITDPLEAIRLAIDFEERSILFYSAIKQVTRQSESKAIDKLIAEEHNHIRRLLALRLQLEADRADRQ